jgi:hypothetical protein
LAGAHDPLYVAGLFIFLVLPGDSVRVSLDARWAVGGGHAGFKNSLIAFSRPHTCTSSAIFTLAYLDRRCCAPAKTSSPSNLPVCTRVQDKQRQRLAE